MKPILKPIEMYELDSYLVKNLGFSSEILMENAASYSSKFIIQNLDHNSNILILCGIGNNGGDGLALVRHLQNYFKVNYAIIGDKSKFTKDTLKNYNILKSLGINEIELKYLNPNEYDCIIDSILGIGSKLPLRENLSTLIQQLNNCNSIKIAIDIPTGLDAESGIADTNTFKADYTLTMYAGKTGLYLNDGKDFTGKVIILNLGIPDTTILRFSEIIHFKHLKFQIRKHNSSKFDYGKCLVIAGSENMPGAGALTSNAAISSGAGIVYHCTTKLGNSIYPEIITLKLSDYSDKIIDNNEFNEIASKCNTIVIGPGLGKSDMNKQMIISILNQYKDKIIIIDADGIGSLDNNIKYNNNIVITPHIGEFSNLINRNRIEILSNLPSLVKETAKNMNITILLKGSTTIISDGEEVVFVTNGLPEMATAGSGDVLSGILGAQLYQNICGKMILNIANAALTHIHAAKLALKEKSHIIASDIIRGLNCIK